MILTAGMVFSVKYLIGFCCREPLNIVLLIPFFLCLTSTKNCFFPLFLIAVLKISRDNSKNRGTWVQFKNCKFKKCIGFEKKISNRSAYSFSNKLQHTVSILHPNLTDQLWQHRVKSRPNWVVCRG